MLRDCLYLIVNFIAHIIQTITGFGGGPLAMPPSIMLVGFDDAKASITLVMLFATAFVAVQNLRHMNYKKFGIIVGLMALGMVPGMWLYSRVPKKILMIVYGVIVVLIGIWKLCAGSKTDLKKPWNYIALLFSGAMQGMFTSGGPFLALYATGAMPDKDEFRATVSPVWTVLNLYLCFSMYQKGMYTSHALQLSVYSIIPVALAIFVGNRINQKINQQMFMKLVYILLMLSGGSLLISALM